MELVGAEPRIGALSHRGSQWEEARARAYHLGVTQQVGEMTGIIMGRPEIILGRRREVVNPRPRLVPAMLEALK